MERERLTEELLHELLDAPTIDSFLGSHELPDISLSDYLQQLLEEKHLERVRVVRMADLNGPLATRFLPDSVIHLATRCCRSPSLWL